MSCNITSAISLGCRDSNGGVQRVWIGAYNTAMSYTLGTSSNTDMITSFTGTTQSFYEVEQATEVAMYSGSGEFSNENWSSVFTNTVEFTINKLTASNNILIKSLGQGKWRAIILDNNGKYFYIGDESPLFATGMTIGAGKSKTDLNGAVITLESRSKSLPLEITEAATLTVRSDV